MTRELMGLTIHRDEHVYGPAEDSLLLADALEPPGSGLGLDIGTGTGLAALRLAEQGARVLATDVNPRACALARRNAEANELDVHPVVTDLAAGLEARFETVVCNPPYLPGEDRSGLAWRALEAGREGTDVTERFLADLPELLAPEGRAWLVVSTHQPLDELRELADERGLTWTVRTEQAVGRFEQLRVVELTHVQPGAHR